MIGHTKIRMNGFKKKKTKISKGYRLKPSTHNRIKEISRSLELCSDTILSMALKLLLKGINKK